MLIEFKKLPENFKLAIETLIKNNELREGEQIILKLTKLKDIIEINRMFDNTFPQYNVLLDFTRFNMALFSLLVESNAEDKEKIEYVILNNIGGWEYYVNCFPSNTKYISLNFNGITWSTGSGGLHVRYALNDVENLTKEQVATIEVNLLSDLDKMSKIENVDNNSIIREYYKDVDGKVKRIKKLGFINEILKDNNVKKVFYDEIMDAIVILTERIICYSKEENTYFDLGDEHFIVIDQHKALGELVIFPNNPYKTDFLCYSGCWSGDCHHPHVNRGGRPCLGNTTDLLCQCLEDLDVYGIFYTALMFLKSVDVYDSAGENIWRYPQVTKEGELIAPGMDDDEFFDKIGEGYITCAECGERIPEDDAYYCDECGCYFCENCVTYVNFEDKYVCKDCLENGEKYVQCYYCDEWFLRTYAVYDKDENVYCDCCADDLDIRNEDEDEDKDDKDKNKDDSVFIDELLTEFIDDLVTEEVSENVI